MSETEFSEAVVERFARAWASIDGKVEAFDRERGVPIPDDIEAVGFTGHYLGYMAEAEELLKRAGCNVSLKSALFPGTPS